MKGEMGRYSFLERMEVAWRGWGFWLVTYLLFHCSIIPRKKDTYISSLLQQK